MKDKEKTHDTIYISYCGLYCGACPKYLKNECKGCKIMDKPTVYKACKVRPCCIENEYNTCADCEKYDSVKMCKDYNPLMIRFGQFITRTNRRKCIEMIKNKGEQAFLKYMIENNLVIMKNKKIKK